jgi:hypothetical protein
MKKKKGNRGKPIKKASKPKIPKGKGKKAKKATNVDFFFDGKDASMAEVTNAIKLVQIRPIILDSSFRKKLSEKLGVKEEQLLDASKKIIAGLKKKR